MPQGRAPRQGRAPWLTIACVLIAIPFAAPLVYLVVRTIGYGSDAIDVLRSDDALGPLTRSLTLAAFVTVACALIGVVSAWLVTRTDLPGRRVWRVLLALPLVIPSFVGAFALIAAFSPGGLLDEVVGFSSPVRVEGFWGAFMVLTLLSYPYVYLPVVARLASLPASLEESARALGRPPLQVFRTVVFPQTLGAISAGSLLVFLYVISDFGAVSLMRYDALTLRIYSTRLFDRTTSLTLSLLLGVVALLVVVLARVVARTSVRGAPATGGGRTLHVPLGRWKYAALGFVIAVCSVALVAPLAVLVRWAWRGLSGSNDTLGSAVDLGDVVTPLANTAGISVVTALVTVVVVLPIAWLTVRHRSRIGGAVNAIVVSGFALPGLVLALAAAFWVLQTPAASFLYQTYPLLIFAYVVHFGAEALSTSQVAVAGVPGRVDDAARSLGAGRIRRLCTVQLPLMRPGLAAATGLVLLSTMKELPSTLLLAPIGFETLATRIWGATEDGFLAKAGVSSLVLVAVSGVLTWLLTIRRMHTIGSSG